MCDPIVATAAVVASTVFSAVSAKSAGKKQARSIQEQGRLNKQVADFNADNLEKTIILNAGIAERNAKLFDAASFEAIKIGADLSTEEREAGRRSIGRARAIFGGSGFQVDTGTFLELQSQEAGFAEINALNVMHNAAKTALGFKLQAADIREQSSASQFIGALEVSNVRKAGEAGQAVSASQASAAKTAGNAAAVSSIVSGLTTIATGGTGLTGFGGSTKPKVT